MRLSELRNILIAQHTELRKLAAAIREQAEAARTGGDALVELRTMLHGFRENLEAHNAFEEQVLSSILPTIDSWGPLCQRLMDTHHADEHAALLYAVADAASSTDPVEVAEAALHLVQTVFVHMDREDHELLHPGVLRDELMPGGVGGQM
jgi:hypothetical protein